MWLLVAVLLWCWIIAFIVVCTSPFPNYACLALVVAAGCCCGVLIAHGGTFLSMVVLLIYLGGMLVVFAYSTALAAEAHPEVFGGGSALGYAVVYVFITVVVALWLGPEWSEFSWVPADELGDFYLFRVDMVGVACMYSSGGGMLVIGAWVLLLTLFVVLEVTRGLSRGTLRAV